MNELIKTVLKLLTEQDRLILGLVLVAFVSVAATLTLLRAVSRLDRVVVKPLGTQVEFGRRTRRPNRDRLVDRDVPSWPADPGSSARVTIGSNQVNTDPCNGQPGQVE